MIDDKIYIDRGIDTGTAALLSNNMNSPLTAMAMMNGGMGMNQWMNNPFIYLIFLAFVWKRVWVWKIMEIVQRMHKSLHWHHKCQITRILI